MRTTAGVGGAHLPPAGLPSSPASAALQPGPLSLLPGSTVRTSAPALRPPSHSSSPLCPGTPSTAMCSRPCMTLPLSPCTATNPRLSASRYAQEGASNGAAEDISWSTLTPTSPATAHASVSPEKASKKHSLKTAGENNQVVTDRPDRQMDCRGTDHIAARKGRATTSPGSSSAGD
jgi:hypothetical protein